MRENGKMASALAIDVALIVLFAALGRRSHDLGLDFSGILFTAAPFLLAWLVGSLVTRTWRTWHQMWPTGIVVWIITVAGGLLLRVTVFNETAAVSFQIVTASVLGVFLLGRRGVTALLARTARRADSQS